MKKHPEECKDYLLLQWTKYRFWCGLFPFVLYWWRQCKGAQESNRNDVWWPGKMKWRRILFSIALSIAEFGQIPLITKLYRMVLKMHKIGQVWKHVWVAGGDFASLTYNFHKHICHLSHWQESIIWNQKIYSHEQKINYTPSNSCASLLTELASL